MAWTYYFAMLQRNIPRGNKRPQALTSKQTVMTERQARMNAIHQAAAIGSGAATGAAPRRFLTFRLGEQEYGVEVQHVLALLRYGALKRVAKGAETVPGVAIVDGRVTPLVDMRVPSQGRRAPDDRLAAAVVLQLHGRDIVMVVDDVLDLVALEAGQIGAPPAPFEGLGRKALIGIATLAQRRLILLDIARMMGVVPAVSLERRAA